MWTRNEARPTVYKGIQFRSALEAKVAEQLDSLSVEWKYEVPADQAIAWFQGPYAEEPPSVPYLPDFLILDAAEYLELPTWVEVKPAELLYALRDHVGCPERFEGSKRYDIDGHQIYGAQIDEIWKPKRAAEIYEHSVLVVSEINRNRTLSALMTPSCIELSKSHPTVNHRELLRVQEQERQAAERQAEWKRREAERRERDRERWAEIFRYARFNSKSARYPGYCRYCNGSRDAEQLVIFRSAEGNWVPICRAHVDTK